MIRKKVLHRLAEIIVSLNRSHPIRVAIDGVDGAGKSMLADELAPLIEERGRPIIRASVDSFHRPRKQRYQQGSASPEGYYEDAFDYASLQNVLLYPLGPGGNRLYRRAAFDVGTDTPVFLPEEEAPANAVLLFDGVFLQRPELIDLWDYRVFLYVNVEVALQRVTHRDLPLFGSVEAVQVRYLQRYIPGQQIYFQIAHPQEHVDVVIDNNDVSHPQLVFPSH